MTRPAHNEPLVLLPGMMCDQRLWQSQIKRFGPDRSISSPSLLGGDSVEAIAADLLRILPDYFALAGLSMGGIVAFEILRRAPERVRRLALFDTNHRADAQERRELRVRQMRDVRAGHLETVLRDELKPNYLSVAHRGNLALLDEVLAMGMDLGEQVFLQQSLALMERPDSSRNLSEVSCPTLVVCGEEDALCPPALHREIAAGIEGSVLHVIENCGHLAPMEQPDVVSDLMEEWLQQ